MKQFAPESLDFVYLDGAHDYANVKKELFDLWPLVRKDGILAGHDYCNYGEAPLGCQGCENVPSCQPYKESMERSTARPKEQGQPTKLV